MPKCALRILQQGGLGQPIHSSWQTAWLSGRPWRFILISISILNEGGDGAESQAHACALNSTLIWDVQRESAWKRDYARIRPDAGPLGALHIDHVCRTVYRSLSIHTTAFLSINLWRWIINLHLGGPPRVLGALRTVRSLHTRALARIDRPGLICV